MSDTACILGPVWQRARVLPNDPDVPGMLLWVSAQMPPGRIPFPHWMENDLTGREVEKPNGESYLLTNLISLDGTEPLMVALSHVELLPEFADVVHIDPVDEAVRQWKVAQCST